MCNTKTDENMGRLSFRAAYTEEEWLFWGNFGYSVKEEFRGNRYATRSCKLML